MRSSRLLKLVALLLLSGLLWSCKQAGQRGPYYPLDSVSKWNEARDAFFKSNKASGWFYEVDGIKGEVIRVQVHPSPDPGTVAITYGETFFNTTGWPIHLTVMKTNDTQRFPGNVFVFDIGQNFALEWEDARTLRINIPDTYFPKPQAFISKSFTRSGDLPYQKTVEGISVKVIPLDNMAFEAKMEAAEAARLQTIKD